MVPVEGISEEELLSIAYALEKKSEHPLAHAILQKAEEAQIHDNLEIKNFLAIMVAITVFPRPTTSARKKPS